MTRTTTPNMWPLNIPSNFAQPPQNCGAQHPAQLITKDRINHSIKMFVPSIIISSLSVRFRCLILFTCVYLAFYWVVVFSKFMIFRCFCGGEGVPESETDPELATNNSTPTTDNTPQNIKIYDSRQSTTSKDQLPSYDEINFNESPPPEYCEVPGPNVEGKDLSK